MPASIDIRGIAVKLLKAHHLRYIDMRSVPDPLTGTKVIILKFRRDKEHSPKAFFDDLNENGIQYKKLVKDPEALAIVCELWPKGQKRQVSEQREKARDQQKAKDKGTSSGPSNGNMPYVGLPSPGTQAVMIQSTAKELRIAGEQDWEEFKRKLNKVLVSMKLHTRPEVRQLRDQIASEIIKELGPDVDLLKGARGSDLEKNINDCIAENIDLVLDTRGIADSVLRRTASLTPAQKVAQLKGIQRGLTTLQAQATASGDQKVADLTQTYVEAVARDIRVLVAGGKSTKVNLANSIFSLVAERKLDAAYLHLVEHSYNG